MKYLSSVILLLPVSFALAQTSFTGGVSNIWNVPENWSNGLPGDADNAGVVPSGQDVVVNVSDNNNRSFSLLVETGASLTVNPAVAFGSSNSALDTTVSGTMTIFGSFTQLGGSSDVFVDGGTLEIADGATLDARKSLTVGNGGALYFGATATNWTPQDRFRISDSGTGGTLGFAIDGDNHTVVTGSSLNLDIGGASTLEIDVANPVEGVFPLVTGISEFRSGNGTLVLREFSTVTVSGLGEASEWNLIYDTEASAGSRGLYFEIVSIPEPATLSAVFGGFLLLLTILRRKR